MEIVNPGGTGSPIRVISARFAPLPPSRSFSSMPPSANPKTYLASSGTPESAAAVCRVSSDCERIVASHGHPGTDSTGKQRYPSSASKWTAQYAPLPPITAPNVRSRMTRSSAGVQLST